MLVVGHGQWGVLSAALVLLNSRSGCILTAAHAILLALGANMYNLRPLLLKYVTWVYRAGTPKFKKYSPCLPRLEFQVDQLHIDKSTAFQDEFWAKQKTWKCGLDFVALEFLLAVLLAILITMQKSYDRQTFINKYQKQFKSN